MEAYKVWATLNLKGDALKKMEQFSKLTKKANTEVDKLIKQNKMLNTIFEKMGMSLKVINPELSKFSTTFIRMNNNISGAASSVSKFNNNITSTSSRLGSVTNKANRLASSLNAVAIQAGLAGRSMGHMKGGKGARNMGSDFAGGLVHGAGFGFAGAGAAALGLGAGMTIKNAFTQGSQYQKYSGQFKALGFSPSEMEDVENITSQTSPGISKLDIMKSLISAQMATRKFSEAKVLAPIIAKAAFVGGSLYDDLSLNQLKSMIRAAEIPGGSDPKNIAKWLDVINRQYITSGATLDFGQQQTFWRQAAGSMLSQKGYLALEPVIQEYGGSRTGTALTTGARAFADPQIANFARYRVKKLIKYGLWDQKNNHLKTEYFNMANSDPDLFAKNILLPHMAAKGVTKPEDINREITSMLPRSYGTFINLLIKNMEKVERSRAQAEKIKSIDELATTVLGMHKEKIKELTASFSNFSQAFDRISGPILDRSITILSKLFDILTIGTNTFADAPSIFNKVASDSGYDPMRILSGSSERRTALDMPSKSASGMGQIENNIHIDGNVLAKVFTKHFNTAHNGLVQYGTSYNNPLQPFAPGLGGTSIGG